MASKKTIYFTDEMEVALDKLVEKTGMKKGEAVREGLFALLVQNDIDAPTPKSVFAGMDMNAFNDVLKRLDALEATGSTPKRQKILQDVEDIQKGK